MSFSIRYYLPFLMLMQMAVSVFAQDFEVAPIRLDFTAEPGENQTKVLNIRNHSNRKVAFIISISDFIPGSDGKKQIMPPATTRRNASDWLNINPSFFELNPGENIPVQVTMLVPVDEYVAAWSILHVQPTIEQTSWDADKALSAGVMVASRIAVSVFQSPASNKNHSLKVTGIKETTGADSNERQFTASIDNLGDKITAAKVFLIASNINTGEEVQFPHIDIETYPKLTRNVELGLPKGKLSPGKYAVAVIVDYGARYTLEGAQIMIDVD